MAVRNIFVNPGDLVIVHVIEDPELPKNKKEWEYSKVHPFKFSFFANNSSVTFFDPGIDIWLQQGTERKRKL